MKKLNVPDNIELSKTIRIIGKKFDKTTAILLKTICFRT